MSTKNRVNKNITHILPYLLVGELVLAAILLCFSDGVSGNDFWWHVKVGEWIAEHKAVPTSDIFSWIGKEYGIAWTAHEWLSELIFYAVFSVTGQAGIYVMSLLLAMTMTALLCFIGAKYIRRNIILSGLFIGLFGVVTSLFFFGRPHIFSYFLLTAELYVLFLFEENPDSRAIWFLPLIACLWSNLHGGSSNLSYILCAVFLLASILNFKCGCVYSARKPKKAIIKLAVVFVLTMAAIFINPIGLKVFVYPYTNLNDSLQMNFISEWQSPDAKKIGILLLDFIPIALMSIGFFAEKDKIRFIDILTGSIFIFLFLRSVRFIILWYIAAVFYAFRYMPLCRIKEINKRWEIIAVVITAVLLLIPIAYGGYKISEKMSSDKLISKTASDEMIAVVKAEEPKRIFNDYNLGEALIFNNIEVFYDSRADLYAAKHIMEDGISLTYLQNAASSSADIYFNVDEIIKKYNFDGILMLKYRPLYTYMISHPEQFELVYEDETTGYFKVHALK